MILWGGVRRLVFRLAPLSAALLLGGCDWAVLDPKGPIGDGNATILVDSVAIMLAIVVPTIVATLGGRLVVPIFQHQGALSAGLRIFRSARIDRLGDSAAHHHAARRGGLDRLA